MSSIALIPDRALPEKVTEGGPPSLCLGLTRAPLNALLGSGWVLDPRSKPEGKLGPERRERGAGLAPTGAAPLSRGVCQGAHHRKTGARPASEKWLWLKYGRLNCQKQITPESLLTRLFSTWFLQTLDGHNPLPSNPHSTWMPRRQALLPAKDESPQSDSFNPGGSDGLHAGNTTPSERSLLSRPARTGGG